MLHILSCYWTPSTRFLLLFQFSRNPWAPYPFPFLTVVEEPNPPWTLQKLLETNMKALKALTWAPCWRKNKWNRTRIPMKGGLMTVCGNVPSLNYYLWVNILACSGFDEKWAWSKIHFWELVISIHFIMLVWVVFLPSSTCGILTQI